MTQTIAELNRINEAAREHARKRLVKLGNEYRSLEAALSDKRAERLAAAVEIADSGLISKEKVWEYGRMARTTLFNELRRLAEEEDNAEHLD